MSGRARQNGSRGALLSPPEKLPMATRSPLVDAYHARLPAAERKALERIRAAVHAAAPGAEECLSYGMPAVQLAGKPLVGWRAAAKHCAFHPLSGSTVATCAAALADHDTSKGTIRFTADKPLSAKLVRLLVATRIAEQTMSGGTPASGKGSAKASAKSATVRPATPAVKRTVAKRGVAKRASAKPAVRPPKRRG